MGKLNRKTSLKRGGFIAKKKGIKRKPLVVDRERLDKDYDFYNFLWEQALSKNCEVCGVYLGSENKTMFHDHLLEKNSHPHLRYDPTNMILVCGECHAQKSMGNPLPKHQEAINNRLKLENQDE